MIVLDLGSAHRYYSRVFSRLGTAGRVFASNPSENLAVLPATQCAAVCQRRNSSYASAIAVELQRCSSRRDTAITVD